MNTTQKFFAALTLPVVGISMASNIASAQVEQADQFENKTERHQQHGRGHMKKFRFNDELTHTIEKLSNGVKIVLTTQNSEILEKIQNRIPKQKDNGVTVTFNTLENGVEITKTTQDSQMVQKMHERVDKHEERKEMREMKESIERNVEQTENGVVITLTSENQEVVEKLQTKEMRESKNEAVNVTKQIIENGVQITISSEDEETIKKIQQRGERTRGKRKGGRRK